MPKIKHKIARYQVSVDGLRRDMVNKMMNDDAETNISAFFCKVITSEFKRRGLSPVILSNYESNYNKKHGL